LRHSRVPDFGRYQNIYIGGAASQAQSLARRVGLTHLGPEHMMFAALPAFYLPTA